MLSVVIAAAGDVSRSKPVPDAQSAFPLATLTNVRPRARRIQYTSGEIEELDLGDIVRERQMSLLPQRP